MKTTVNVSLNGRAFIVEEDAYEMLKNYLSDIKSRLDYTENEILSDVENRVAEILSQKVNNALQVVNISMVQSVISIIGAPHYFGAERTDKQTFDTPPPRTRYVEVERKLMRDGNRRFFGGVCAGLASYFGTDITLVRILALILFFCVGFGLIPYLILWIIIPKATTPQELEMMERGYNK